MHSRSLISVAVAAALLSATAHAAPIQVRGVVAGTLFTPPVNASSPANSTAGVTVPSVYAGAKVCFDLNDNGVCDAGLSTIVQPAASAGPHLRVIIAAGKFHGVIAAQTPIGSLRTTIRLSTPCEGMVSP